MQIAGGSSATSARVCVRVCGWQRKVFNPAKPASNVASEHAVAAQICRTFGDVIRHRFAPQFL